MYRLTSQEMFKMSYDIFTAPFAKQRGIKNIKGKDVCANKTLQFMLKLPLGHRITTRRNGFKLKEARFRLGICKKFFISEVHNREGLDVPSLEVSKAMLDGVLSNLVCPWMCPCPWQWDWN